MPNPNKGDEFDQWPRYALCYGHFMLYVTICVKTARIWVKVVKIWVNHMLKDDTSTLAILRRARRRANLNRKSSGNLTHIFANLALVTHISAQVADLCVK